MNKLICSLLILLLFISCKKEDNTNTATYDYLIFGHFYGMCWSEECVETYKLTTNSLYEDTLDDYMHNSFSFTQLSQAKFNQVSSLLNNISNDLLNETDTIIGCPDCADQGGVYVQISENGIVKRWLIDQANVAPQSIQDFKEEINEKIGIINQ